MSDDSLTTGSSARPAGGWLDRHSVVLPVLASAAFLQVAQGVLMSLKYGSLGTEASGAMAVFGIWIAPVTLLALLPVILLVRRRHPAWKQGDRHRASWAVSFGLTAAIVGWMIADQAAASVGVSPLVEPWLEALVALGAGLAASTWVQVSARWLKVGAAFVPVALAGTVLLAPDPPGPPPGARRRTRQFRALWRTSDLFRRPAPTWFWSRSIPFAPTGSAPTVGCHH